MATLNRGSSNVACANARLAQRAVTAVDGLHFDLQKGSRPFPYTARRPYCEASNAWRSLPQARVQTAATQDQGLPKTLDGSLTS